MGYHYVPQEYLRGFADVSAQDMIWLYDKEGGEPRLVPIEKVAQSKGYYDDDVEAELAKAIEGPANLVIRQLRQGELISLPQRRQLALYMGVMLMRVPYRRAKAYELVPQTWQETVDKFRSQIRQIAATTDIAPEVIERRLAEVDAIEEKHRHNPPQSVHDQIRRPYPTHQMVEALFSMTWRLLRSQGPLNFITSDNPAHFFEAYGLATEKSELAFPISKELVLHGCWQHRGNRIVFGTATQHFVKEFNRRVASTTTRLAFYSERVDWLQPLLQKQRLYLSRIQWA